jgi:hypothetical protein
MVILTEHEEQREFVSWFRQTYPDVRIFAIPNGEKRSIKTAIRLKSEGVSPGVPDLFVPAWSLWIEMKRKTGGFVRPDQRKWIEYLQGCGHQVIVGYGFEDAKTKIGERK